MANIRGALVEQIGDAMEAVDPKITVVSGRYFNPTPPCVDVYMAPTSRDEESAAFGDLAGSYVFTVRVRVLTVDNPAGLEFLMRFQDDEDELSILAAIAADPTLGGYAYDTHVPESGFSGDVEYAEEVSRFLGCEWRVVVIKAES